MTMQTGACSFQKDGHLFSNRQIMAMLLPLMAEQLLITMMGMVNTFMVAHVGSYAISAVSLVDSVNVLVIQAFYALGAGGTIVCAQYLRSSGA